MSAPAVGRQVPVHLRFQVGPRRFALPVEEVSQVAPLQSIRPVPRTPGFIRGLMEYQGRLLTVLDALRLLGDGPVGRPDEESLLVLARPFQHLALAIPGLPSVGPAHDPPAPRNDPVGSPGPTAGRVEEGARGGNPEEGGILEAEELVRRCRDQMERFQTGTAPGSTAAGG